MLSMGFSKADALIAEAAVASSGSPFADIPDSPPLAERLSPALLTQLRETIEGLDLSQSEFETRPAWPIALVLQAMQAQRLGLRPDCGIDYQLLQAARQFSTPVIELEGTENQVAILRQLADGGLELLQDTLTHWRENARLLQVMMSWWLDSPP
ncbi:TraB/GumN family protein, partial [Herbaspirillum sp. VT-16-41]|uniref:TraB/GumN family protein n=1 Tax=Herbaspirillum sp. VT-16-41 TaxID=1953765 RepID=UPI0009CCF5C9